MSPPAADLDRRKRYLRARRWLVFNGALSVAVAAVLLVFAAKSLFEGHWLAGAVPAAIAVFSLGVTFGQALVFRRAWRTMDS